MECKRGHIHGNAYPGRSKRYKSVIARSPKQYKCICMGSNSQWMDKSLYEDEQGSVFFGYIRSDLLELA